MHGYNKRFSDFVRYNVRPLSYRRYDTKTHRWAVHVSKLAPVVTYAKTQFDAVDYRSLPPDLQLKLVAEMSGRGSASVIPIIEAGPRDAYQMLHVLQTAPWEVIKAAYKAMVFLNHPDRGGSTETTVLLQEAFEELSQLHRSKS